MKNVNFMDLMDLKKKSKIELKNPKKSLKIWINFWFIKIEI